MSGTAGGFQWPFDKTGQVWPLGDPGCGVGYSEPTKNGQYYLQQYMNLLDPTDKLNGKYHIGEDWNGKCGSDTDLYGPLFAIADGTVFDIYLEGSAKSNGGGNVIVIDYTLPDGITVVRSQYLHVSEFFVSRGNPISKGMMVGKIGNTGFSQGPHLHWDMIINPSTYGGGYANPLTPERAMRATSGSLFVDDRSNPTQPLSLSSGTWNTFYINKNTPSSTAYIEYRGNKYSIQESCHKQHNTQRSVLVEWQWVGRIQRLKRYFL